MRGIVTILVVAWLAIGAYAAYQRDYFTDQRRVSCHTVSDTALTVAAGPLNYFGVNPKVRCKTPKPSK